MKQNARTLPATVNSRLKAVQDWQLWVAKVNAIVPDFADTHIANLDDNEEREIDLHASDIVIPPQSDLTVEHSIDVFRHFLPLWQWDFHESEFEWESNFPADVALTSYASLHQDDWKNAVALFQQLKWKRNPDLRVSYLELAFEFWYRNIPTSCPSPTICDIVKMLRKVVNQSSKLHVHGLLTPGVQKPGYKSNGKTHPAGFVSEAYPLLSITSLKHLAVFFMRGHDQSLKSWKVAFPLKGS